MALFSKKQNETSAKAKVTKKPAVKKEVVKEEKSESMQDLYKEETKKLEGKKTAKSGLAHRVLVKPLVTEKAANLSSHNQYVFMVSKTANKISVAKAISEVYGVKPLSINMVNVKGKVVRRGRITGKRSDWKKAVITLAKGQTIKVYEGV